MSLSRRNFLKNVATGTVAASTIAVLPFGVKNANAASATTLPEKWDIETDIIVVGTGCSGTPAAVEAAKKGAKVVILEKRAVTGGDIVLSAGVFYAAKTKHHVAAGITEGVSPDEYWAYLEAGGDDEPLNRIRDNSQLSPIYYGITKHNPNILRRNAYESAELIDYLDKYDVDWLPMNKLKPWQINARHGEMGKLMQKMLKDARNNGATLMTETRALKLYSDDSGAVIGLTAENEDGEMINIKSKAVILATGGFIDSPYLMKRYQAYWDRVPRGFIAKGKGVYHDHTGDGILMAKALNASLEDMAAGVKLYAGPDNAKTPPVGWLIFDTEVAYLVNEKGKRITNEVQSRYNGCALAVLRTKSKAGYCVFDDKTFNGPANERYGLNNALKNGGLFKADTPEALAQAVGIDAQGLKETIARINSDAEKGVDTEFGKNSNIFKPLKAPFYISAPAGPLSYKTEGGIETNEDYQVLEHIDEKPIAGLYAVGATVGSISSRHLDCLNSGIIAGRLVADRVQGKA